MRIVLTANSAWNIYNFRTGLIDALVDRSHEVIVIAPDDRYVIKFINRKVSFIPIDINPKSVNPFKELLVIFQYLKIYYKVKPDLVLSFTIKPNIYSSIACRFLKVRSISNVSGLGTTFIKRSFTTIFVKRLYRYAFKSSYWIFFQNRADYETFIFLGLVKPDAIGILPGSGVDLARFKANRITNSGKKFLFVGRIIGDKGIREFVNAANKLSKEDKTLKFLIAGEAGYNNRTTIKPMEIESWLSNPQINLLGAKENMIHVYSDSDIMVLPSYREGMSKALLEALAMSLPIITTNVPGCKEAVNNNQNGYLCNPKDYNDLYIKMRRMAFIDEERRLKMGVISRQKAEAEFDEEIVIRAYLFKINEITDVQ